MAEKATELNEFIISHAPSFIQRAAQTALGEGEAELGKMLVRLRRTVISVLAALRRMPGVTVPSPDGAFYLFPRIEGLRDSFAFCRKLLEESRVGLAPGRPLEPAARGRSVSAMAAERKILEQPWRGSNGFWKNRGWQTRRLDAGGGP